MINRTWTRADVIDCVHDLLLSPSTVTPALIFSYISSITQGNAQQLDFPDCIIDPSKCRLLSILIHRANSRIPQRILMHMRPLPRQDIHARVHLLKAPQIHRRIQQRQDVRIKRLPVWVVEVVLLGLLMNALAIVILHPHHLCFNLHRHCPSRRLALAPLEREKSQSCHMKLGK